MIKTISIVGSAKVNPEDLGTYPALRRYLELEGFRTTSEKESDFLVAVNHSQESYKRFTQGGGQSNHAVLVRLEPDSVFPQQYRSKTMDKYGLILTPGSTLDQKGSKSFVGWPYQYNLNPTRPNASDPSLLSILNDKSWEELFRLRHWLLRPRKMTMIAANKVSPLRNANYSIRRNLASQLSPKILDVYGPLWTDNITAKIHHRLAVAGISLRQGSLPNLLSIYGSLFRKYPSARGTIRDKHAILRETKFSLVIENSNSYVSEKLIDAMINGSIPIYVGPGLEKVGLPKEIAIHSSGDPKEVLQIIETLDSIGAAEKLIAMREFLISPCFFDLWTEHSVYKKLSHQIAEYFRR